MNEDCISIQAKRTKKEQVSGLWILSWDGSSAYIIKHMQIKVQ
jgi:hypothetical protein